MYRTEVSGTPREALTELALHGKISSQHLELLFEPVHDLLRGRCTTFFCIPSFCVGDEAIITGYSAFSSASDGDLPLIDRAMLAHSLKFSRRLAESNVFSAIGAPVSFRTLASDSGRTIFLEALRASGAPESPSLVLCIKDIPAGVSASRLAEMIGWLRPYAKRIFAHLAGAEGALANCPYLGADGFVLSLSGKQSVEQAHKTAHWLAQFCETQTALSCIDTIENDEAMEAVRSEAVRFGAGNTFGKVRFRGNAAAFEVESYMRSASRGAPAKSRPGRTGSRQAGASRQLRAQ